MARTPLSRLAGVNLQKLDGPGDSDLNLANHMVFDPSAAYLPELRARVPDTVIFLRAIQGVNSFWDDPRRTARQCADLVHQFPQADRIVPANEQNFEFNASSVAIAEWSNAFIEEWARQGWLRPVVTPAVSTGRAFNLSQLQAAWARWDFIGVHAYATFDDLSFGPAKGHIQAHRGTWPGKTLSLTETNIEQLEQTTYRHQEGTDAYLNFLHWLVAIGYVDVAQWFLKEAEHGDQPYQMVKIPPLLSLHRMLGHQVDGGGQAPPSPEPPTGGVARIEAIYRITHTDSERMVLARLVERGDPPTIRAQGPPDARIVVRTADGQHRAEGTGSAELGFSHPAAYQPISEGEMGFYEAECEGAVVRGLGWAYDQPPVLQAPHSNVLVEFVRRATRPDPEPPPADNGGWSGAFADYFKAHPQIGRAEGDVAYHPEQGPWETAGQVSATTLLIWDGWKVIELPRG